MKIRFFKGNGKFGYKKLHMPLGTLYPHTSVDLNFDPSDGKKRRIYATHRILEVPLLAIRAESVPVIS